MKREENQLQQAPKHRSVFKYELKATNQILKDTRDLCYSSAYSTARTNKLNHLNYEDYQVTPFQDNPPARNYNSLPSKSLKEKTPKDPPLADFCRQKNDKKFVFQEYGYIPGSFHKEKYPPAQFKKSKQDQQFDAYDYINPSFNYFSQENDQYHSNRIPSGFEKSGQSLNRKMISSEGKKDIKKQRRGLAQISLKVKNIVAKMKKMTFKQVSDQVLRESEQDLPHDPEQREKQTKNIRRRVYDALNVLVSVNILGKQQRCVVHTAATSIPGKKLSEHWHIINQKNRILDEKKNDYKKKLANLALLKKNIEMMQKFHQRNRKINERQDKKDQVTRSQHKEPQPLNKWQFPLVFLVPPRNLNNKIKIQLQFMQSKQEYIKKITIDNNDYILTDLDVLKYLNLSSEVEPPAQRQSLIIEKIKSPQDVHEESFEQMDKGSVEQGCIMKKQLIDQPYLQD